MWIFNGKKKAKQDRDETRRVKVAASQLALLEAATTTADAAQHVTNRLRQHLSDSIRQFESTARLISDALIVCDKNGKIQAFNPAAENIFATTASNISQTSITNLFQLNNAKIDAETLWNAIENNLDGDEFSPLQGIRCNNEKFATDASLTRLDKEDGSSLILLLIRDLSDKIQCRRLTQVHSERFQSLFNISFDGIMIIQDSKIVAANRAASLLYGLEPELLLHTPSHVLLHSNIIVSEPTETDGTYKDGSTLQLLFSSTSITWNELPAHLVTIKNVSEMRQLRKALVSKFDGLDMICVFDSNFKIKFTNSYFKQYYNCEHTVGKDIRELIPTSDRDTFAIKINALTKTNPTVRNQVQHITETGESRLLDWIDHAVFDDNGNVIEYQRTGRDITSVLINLMQHPE